MSVAFRCACGKAFRVKDELAGKRARCPQCQGEVVVPLVSTEPIAPVKANTQAAAEAFPPAPAVPAPPPLPPTPVGGQFGYGAPPTQPAPANAAYGYPAPPTAGGYPPPMQAANPFFLGDAGAVSGMVPMAGAIGMPQSGMGNPYQSPGIMLGQPGFMDSASARTKKKKPVTAGQSRSSRGEGMFNSGVGLGVLMLVGSVVWFGAGLAAGYIFFYPPILFIAGLVSIGKGMMGGD